jgi:acetamidase/formamidase
MDRLPATPDHCFWGFLDPALAPVLTIDDGTELTIEAVTHHAGDAPDLLMDDGVRAIWDGIPEADRAPGVHIMTGPVEISGASPGDTLRVEILEMVPRLPYGANCAANWGLLYDTFAKERITIYGLAGDGATFPATATPLFGFDFDGRPTYDTPGVVSPPDPGRRQPFSRPVAVDVRPHLGVMGVAPGEGGRRSSIPPGVFGGNVDNWRFGPGAVVRYPVFVEGARFYVGDPHFAQGDGEICGTAIEASLDVRLRLSVERGVTIPSPVLETPTHVFTHGFGADLDEAMRMAAELAVQLLVDRGGFSAEEAYSLASVAVDVGVTQVVDGTLGCHAAVPRSLLLT